MDMCVYTSDRVIDKNDHRDRTSEHGTDHTYQYPFVFTLVLIIFHRMISSHKHSHTYYKVLMCERKPIIFSVCDILHDLFGLERFGD